MLVQASVVVAIEAAAQLSDSTHIMLYSIRWEYRDTPGGPVTGGSYCMHGAVAHSVSRVAQRMAGWRDSALPVEWVAAVTVAHPMSDSTLPHSIPMIRHGWTRDHNDSVADAVSYLSHQSVTFFISHAHTISLLLYHLSFIPDPSVIPPIIIYHHW